MPRKRCSRHSLCKKLTCFQILMGRNHTEIIISKCIMPVLHSFETFLCRIFRLRNTDFLISIYNKQGTKLSANTYAGEKKK